MSKFTLNQDIKFYWSNTYIIEVKGLPDSIALFADEFDNCGNPIEFSAVDYFSGGVCHWFTSLDSVFDWLLKQPNFEEFEVDGARLFTRKIQDVKFGQLYSTNNGKTLLMVITIDGKYTFVDRCGFVPLTPLSRSVFTEYIRNNNFVLMSDNCEFSARDKQ